VLSSSRSDPQVEAAKEKEEKATSQTSTVKSRFLSNEIFIKVKREVRNRVQENPQNPGIASLSKIFRKHSVKKFGKVVNSGQKSKSEADLFSWFKVTLEGETKEIEAELDKGKKTLDSPDPKVFELGRVIEELRSDPNVIEAEPNFVVETSIVPNDPYYSSSGSWGQTYPDLWGLKKINSEKAWDQVTGSTSVIVASIDTGVDRNHEDLKENMWVNSAEVPLNGRDDDGNGYVDDYYGWDFINNDNDPMDDHGHGTHTAGTITAAGNNSLGVVGVSWKSKIMALKFLNMNGGGTTGAAVGALHYAADMGAKISSNSWGALGQSSLIDDAIKYEHDRGMVIVVAAGNDGADALDYSPASADYALTIGATDPNDNRAPFSNWGEKIDVTAPGADILSLKAPNGWGCSALVGTSYCRMSGTSMATPHVAGLAALLVSLYPTLTNEEIRQILRSSAVDLGSVGKDLHFGYGRIDAGYALSSASTSSVLAPVITSPSSREVVSGSAVEILGGITGKDFANFKVEAGYGRTPSTWLEVANSTTQVTGGVLATVNTTQLTEGLNTILLTATSTSGKTFRFQIFDLEVDNFEAQVTFPTTLVSKGVVEIIGTALVKGDLTFDRYQIEWGVGSAPSSWSALGISLLNQGHQPVQNNLLGTWETSALNDGGTYTIRLRVDSTQGPYFQKLFTFRLDKDLPSGWPKPIEAQGVSFPNSIPVAADLNGDGQKEVIVLGPAGKIYAFRRDGSTLPGFPVKIENDYYFDVPPNVYDLDNDGKQEIIAVSTNNASRIQDGLRKLYVIRSDGTFHPQWPIPSLKISRHSDGTPAMADLNGDGVKEMVVLEGLSGFTLPNTFTLHAYRINGTEISGFPKRFNVNDDILGYGSPVVEDLDKDGQVEIAFGNEDKFYLLNNQGDILPGWPLTIPLSSSGEKMLLRDAASVGDIDGSGLLEVVAMAGTQGGNNLLVYAWQKDASYLTGWPQAANRYLNAWLPINSPSLADIDGDGQDEVAVGTYGLRVYDWEGLKFQESSTTFASSVTPSISDVNGDGRLEFLGGYGQRVSIIDDKGGTYWERIFQNLDYGYFWNSGMIADLDNNGRLELIIVRGPSSPTVSHGYLYVWEIPLSGENLASYDWPMFAHDPARSGRLTVFSKSDFDQNGRVDSLDAQKFFSHWGRPFQDPLIDLSKDGVINGLDYSYFRKDWSW
jgi:subtilisin family serine protease